MSLLLGGDTHNLEVPGRKRGRRPSEKLMCTLGVGEV